MTVHSSYFPIFANPGQLADAGPFTLSCVGEVMVEAPDVGTYPRQVTIMLGRFRGFAEAFACAKRRGQRRDLCVDAVSGFAPNLLVIEDAQKRLCAAGQISPSGLEPCDPVTSEAEARWVMQNAIQLRARSIDELNPRTARNLRFQAAALDARLIDPVWRLAPVAQLQAA